MRAELKNIHCPTVNDLRYYKPDDPDIFCLLLQIFVGIPGGRGEESFDIEVCTPQWLISNYKKDEIIIGRHLLIVFEFDFERISGKIRQFVDCCCGETWYEIAQKIGRIGYWEFEDYRNSPDSTSSY